MIEYRLWRQSLDDGETTTVYAVRHPIERTRVRVVFFARPQRLDVVCRSTAVEEAVVGGFFVRDPYRPLGEVWAAGRGVRHEPLPAVYAPRRACVVSDGGGVRIVARDAAPERPDGDLLQAGPLLVADGAVAFDPQADHEGFSAASEQFDSDITQDRHPRAAFGIADDALITVACDGRRTNVDAGLSMLGSRRSWSTSGRSARSTSTVAADDARPPRASLDRRTPTRTSPRRRPAGS